MGVQQGGLACLQWYRLSVAATSPQALCHSSATRRCMQPQGLVVLSSWQGLAQAAPASSQRQGQPLLLLSMQL
jgi:hypothetical protein